MKELKKAIRTTVLFLLVLIVLSAGLMEVYFESESEYYQDASVRTELAGTLDYLLVGASRIERSFDTRVLDEELGVNSYNLGSPGLPSDARYDLLLKELNRNPVEEVIIEASAETLRPGRDASNLEGTLYYLGRLDSVGERVAYFSQHVKPKDYSASYQFLIVRGVAAVKYLLKLDDTTEIREKYQQKGLALYDTEEPSDQTIDYAAKYKVRSMDTNPDESRVEDLQRCVDLCKERGVKIRLVNVITSKALICQTDGYEEYHTFLKDFAEKNQVEYYDFNLLKNREEMFPDENSFYDEFHLYNDSMTKFTEVYVDVIQRADAGEDISSLFYGTYEEFEQSQDYYPAG